MSNASAKRPRPNRSENDVETCSQHRYNTVHFDVACPDCKITCTTCGHKRRACDFYRASRAQPSDKLLVKLWKASCKECMRSATHSQSTRVCCLRGLHSAEKRASSDTRCGHAGDADRAASQAEERRLAQAQLISRALEGFVHFHAVKPTEAAVEAYDSHEYVKLIQKGRADIPPTEEDECKQPAKELPADHPDPVGWLLKRASWFDPALQAAFGQAEETLAPLREAKEAALEKVDQDMQHFYEAVGNLTNEQREGLLAAICPHTFCKSTADFAALTMGDAWADHAIEVAYGNPATAPTDFSATGLTTWLCSLREDLITATWPHDGERWE